MEPSEEALNILRTALESLRESVLRGERDSIEINLDDCRPMDEWDYIGLAVLDSHYEDDESSEVK